jgi:MEMO1 family protein
MRVRPRSLPPGWYPDTAERAARALDGFTKSFPRTAPHACAGIAPHAGWEFSGSLAAQVVSCIVPGMDTIVIIGGHLASADGIMCLTEDAFETPLGPIETDRELLEALSGVLPMEDDEERDNTIEIQLPLIRYFAPEARAVGLRVPPSAVAERLGALIGETAARIGRRVAVLGSTDLTHYGAGYGFAPRQPDPVAWVRDVNDKRFIEAALAMDAAGVVDKATREHSACSAGGAAAAITFARSRGAASGALLAYRSSFEVHRSESFVGYAGIVYR